MGRRCIVAVVRLGGFWLALTDLQIATLIAKYGRERDRFEKMATIVAGRVRRALKLAAVQHILTFRAKDPDSLRKKLEKDRDKHDFARMVEEFGPSLKDVAGVRIMVYLPDDVDRAVQAVERTFDVPEGGSFRKEFAAEGYKAVHRTVHLPSDLQESDPSLGNLSGVFCEIQITTILDHVWNELEHDIKYKTPNGSPSRSQLVALDALRGSLDSAQKNVKQLVEETTAQIAAPARSIDDFVPLLARTLRKAPTGEVDRLFQLLASTLKAVNVAELERIGVSPGLMAVGRDCAAVLGLVEIDDVCAIVAGLWEPFGEQFLDIARTWRGKPGPTKRMIDALRQPTRKEAEPDADT